MLAVENMEFNPRLSGSLFHPCSKVIEQVGRVGGDSEQPGVIHFRIPRADFFLAEQDVAFGALFDLANPEPRAGLCRRR